MQIGTSKLFNGGKMTILEHDIVLIEYFNKKMIELEHIIATRDMRKELLGDVPYYPIIDLSAGFYSISTEAKEWIAHSTSYAKRREMDVFLVNHWGIKMEVTLYLKMQKPIVTTKVVTTIENALLEIKKFKESK